MDAKQEFVETLIKAGALGFGEFTTKSGRLSPYFINMGRFNRGSYLNALASAYADHAHSVFGDRVDNLFGPAYKGIPLCASVAMAMCQRHGRDIGFTYNRKEAKDHGEGGVLVGDCYEEARKVLIVEDVITAGTAIRETMGILSAYPKARVVGVLVAVDRRERLEDGVSALDALRAKYGIEASAIIDIDDIIAWVEGRGPASGFSLPRGTLDSIREYRDKWGCV